MIYKWNLPFYALDNSIYDSIVMSSQPEGWGTYCFWCGTCWGRRSFFSVPYLLNQRMNFAQTCIDTLLGGGTCGLDLGDLDLIFKVTPEL